jgi:hypothetical protein
MRANRQIVQDMTVLLRAIAETQNATVLLRVIAEMADAAVSAGSDMDMRKCIEVLTRAAELIGAAVSLPAATAVLPSFPTYDPRTKTLTCGQCGRTFDSNVKLRGHLSWCGKRSTVAHTCIASGCRCRAKGPRFHFLCKKHLKATTGQIQRWRDQRRAAAEG